MENRENRAKQHFLVITHLNIISTQNEPKVNDGTIHQTTKHKQKHCHTLLNLPAFLALKKAGRAEGVNRRLTKGGKPKNSEM